MFEYLMPLLVMPTYENTLLDQTYAAAGRAADRVRQAARRAVGHVGIRLQRRRRPPQLPVPRVRRPGPGPEARARRGSGRRAVCVGARADGRARDSVPEPAAARRRRVRWAGSACYEAIDYTPSRQRRAAQRSAVVRSFMAHHQGMSLLSCAYVLLGRPMQRRFEVGPAVSGDAAAAAGAHPAGQRSSSPARPTSPHPRAAGSGLEAAGARDLQRPDTRDSGSAACCRTAATTSWSPMPAAAAAAGRTSP